MENIRIKHTKTYFIYYSSVEIERKFKNYEYYLLEKIALLGVIRCFFECTSSKYSSIYTRTST